ncbi:hypothetical protein VUR80DRAFT_285 [Thermomyces stellatus]
MCTVTYLGTTCIVCKKTMGPQLHREHILSRAKPGEPRVLWIGHVLRLDDQPDIDQCSEPEPHEVRPVMGWQKRLDRCSACIEKIPLEKRMDSVSLKPGEWVMWVEIGWLVLRREPGPAALFEFLKEFGWPARILRPEASEDESVPYPLAALVS